MHIPTIEEDYEYRMKRIVSNFVRNYPELKDLSTEDLQDKLWRLCNRVYTRSYRRYD